MRKYFPITNLNLSDYERERVDLVLSQTTGFFAREIYKRFSLLVSLPLARMKVNPNVITLVNLVIGLFAAYYAVLGETYFNFFMAGFLFLLVAVVDGIDGAIAKINQQTSKIGAWFDTIGDNLSLILFLVGISIGVAKTQDTKYVIYAGQIALVSTVLLLSIMFLYLIKGTESKGSLITYDKEVVTPFFEKQGGFLGKSILYAKILVKKDCFSLIFFIFTTVNLPGMVVYGTAFATSIAALVLSVITLKVQAENKRILKLKQNQELTQTA